MRTLLISHFIRSRTTSPLVFSIRSKSTDRPNTRNVTHTHITLRLCDENVKHTRNVTHTHVTLRLCDENVKHTRNVTHTHVTLRLCDENVKHTRNVTHTHVTLRLCDENVKHTPLHSMLNISLHQFKCNLSQWCLHRYTTDISKHIASMPAVHNVSAADHRTWSGSHWPKQSKILILSLMATNSRHRARWHVPA